MNLTEFHSLEVGDHIHHPYIGTHVIEFVEKRYNYDAPRSNQHPYYPQITHTVTISNGRRLKEGDHRDLPFVSLIPPSYLIDDPCPDED